MLETFYTLFGAFDQHDTYLANQDNFLNTVFPFLAFSAVGLALLFAFIYYILLNRLSSSFNSIGSWLLFLSINLFIVAGIALYESVSNTQAEGADAFVIILAVTNAVYTTVFYFAFSLLLKYGSKYAKGTPF